MNRRPANRRSLAFVVGLIAAVACALAPAAPAALTKSERQLQKRLDELVRIDGGPPGASVLLSRGRQTKFLRAGVANVDTGAPFKRNKHMKIGSVSKAFSGAVALSLVDEGKLSLDDTIGERLPDLPAPWWPVTLREILSHTGGIPNFTKSEGYQKYFGAHLHGQISKLGLIDFVRDQPLTYPPGTRYEYSNTDNVIVALMAEEATGRSYEQLLRRKVLQPLGLHQTKLARGWKVPAPLIHGYDTLPAIEDLTTCCSMSFVSASGGIYSTPREVTRFVRGYVGGELFGRAQHRAQFDFRVGGGSEPPGPGEQSVGLGVFRYRTRCGTVFGHTGNFPGYTQFTASTRNGRRGLTFSVNRQLNHDAPGELAPQAFKTLRKDFGHAVCTLLDG